jgi:ABC-type Na+ efflux pump permease subunit
MRRKQIFALSKQEIKIAIRSKYIIIAFIIVPLFLWAFQGGLQYFIVMTMGGDDDTPIYEGDTIFVSNLDSGNGTHNYGNSLVSDMIALTGNENSSLYRSNIDPQSYAGSSYDEAQGLVLSDNVSPIVVIPENFTELINSYNGSNIPAFVYIFFKPNHQTFGNTLQFELWQIVSQPPYTVYTMIKASTANMVSVTYEGEEGAANPMTTGFLSYILILLTVMAPAPFVSASFAGEREKRTLEALLALPIRKFDVLSAKLLAGMVLIGIFAFFNLIGLFIYDFIMKKVVEQVDSDLVFGFDLSFRTVISILGMIILSAFIAIGIGISIASLTKDSRTSETAYMAVMMAPALIIGFMSLLGLLPNEWSPLHLIPWTHAIQVMNKGMFPGTYAHLTLTGSVLLDIVVHLAYLLFFVIMSIFIASKIFGRESILKS